MVLLAILAAIALAAIGLLVWTLRSAAPRNASFEQLESQIHQIDLPAFQNLTDPSETLFLASSLSPRVFRSVQRGRILAAIHYLSALSANAAIFMRMGDLAGHSDDAGIAESGRALSNAALHTRLLVLRAYCFLVPQWIFPSEKPEWSPGIFAHYDQLKRCLIHLVSVQQPSMTSRSVRIF
jgi:type II secretory pathway pseudopilin PulG